VICKIRWNAGREVLRESRYVAGAGEVEEFGGEFKSFGWEIGT
jgi:hypothetical protein